MTFQVSADIGCEATFTLRSVEGLSELLELAETASTPPSAALTAHLVHHHVRLAALRGDAEPAWTSAIDALRSLGEPFGVAIVQLETAEWLAEHGRIGEAPPLLAEAHAAFERLGAIPKHEQAQRLEEAAAATAT